MAPTAAWRFEQIALEEGEALLALFAAERPRVVVNLAAQRRGLLENPAAYIQSNLVGFGHILEGCRHRRGELVYAQQFGLWRQPQLPFDERQPVNHPVSPHAASKKANELMSTPTAIPRAASHGLALFTVYVLGAVLIWHRCYSPAILRGTHLGVQPRPDAARLHLYRRHRGGGAALLR